MKKTWLLFASITLAISMLAACNSNDESNGTKDDTQEHAESDTTATDEVTEVVEEDIAAVKEDSEEQPATEERAAQMTLNYLANGEEKEESATLTESDEQNYSIYKLDGYSLTGEEPNKDSLCLDDNSAVFMRVETISKDEAAYDVIAENMSQSIAAVSIGSEPVKIDNKEKLPQGEGITNPIGFETTFELGTVSGYVFEQGNLIVRLTIFDQSSVNLTDALLKMGQTVAVK